MAADVRFIPHDERGQEILDKLESETGQGSERDEETGARTYYLSSHEAGPDAFDPVLNRIDPAWQEHLSRTP